LIEKYSSEIEEALIQKHNMKEEDSSISEEIKSMV
jgi:hypothetical protein